ncbi:transcriptional regulator [Halorubrum sp. 48-1-W]|nr:transcriptional regulator [Halorubrum sp. 48-1-W]
MSRTDYRILEALADAEILAVQSPAIVAFNLDITREWASQRLGELGERGLVEKVADGKYRITDAGRAEVTET